MAPDFSVLGYILLLHTLFHLWVVSHPEFAFKMGSYINVFFLNKFNISLTNPPTLGLAAATILTQSPTPKVGQTQDASSPAGRSPESQIW